MFYIAGLGFGVKPAPSFGAQYAGLGALLFIALVAGAAYYFATREEAEAYAAAHGGTVVMQERTIPGSLKLIEKAFEAAVKAVTAAEKATVVKGDKAPDGVVVARSANKRDEALGKLERELARAVAFAPGAGDRFAGFSRSKALEDGLKVHARAVRDADAVKAKADSAKAKAAV